MPIRFRPLASTSSIGISAAIRLIAVILLATAGFAACGNDDAPAATATAPQSAAFGFGNLSASTLAELLEDKDFPLINVHVPYEGEIEPTDHFIQYDEIDAHLDLLPDDRDAQIVLYCRSGSMSATAARTLVALGYTNVAHLEGGMIAWEEAGYPLVVREGATTSGTP